MRRLSLLFLCFVLFASPPAFAQKRVVRVAIDEFQIAKWATDNRDALKIPSLAVGIVGPTGNHFLEVWGDAEPDDTFLIGSLTKSVTAMAIMLLKHEGKLSLDDPASKWVDGVPDAVTVRHLLYQTSGLDRSDGYEAWTNLDATVESSVAAASWGPVGEFAYSNLNYQILGEVVAEVSAMPYPEFLKVRIFEPLGMKTATAKRPVDGVVGHQYMFGFPQPFGEPEYGDATVPSGFVWMSANDMATWLRVFIDRGKIDDAQVIPAEVIDELLAKPENTSYAAGWMMTSAYEPTVVARHNGATGAFTSAMAIVPERQFGVFALANVNSWMAVGPSNIVKGIVAPMLDAEKETVTNLEFIGRLIFGIIVALIVFTFVFELMRWFRAGFPFRLMRKELVAVALTVVINIAVVIGVVVYFETSLSVMYATQPDITIGFLVTVVIGTLRRLLTGFNKSALFALTPPDEY